MHGHGELCALKCTALRCVSTIKIEKSVSQQPLLLKRNFCLSVLFCTSVAAMQTCCSSQNQLHMSLANPFLATADAPAKCPICNVRLYNGGCIDHGKPSTQEALQHVPVVPLPGEGAISKQLAVQYRAELKTQTLSQGSGRPLEASEAVKRLVSLRKRNAALPARYREADKKVLEELQKNLPKHITAEADRIIGALTKEIRDVGGAVAALRADVLAMARGEIVLEDGASLQEQRAACNVAMAVLVNKRRAIMAAQKEEKASAKAAARPSSVPSAKRSRKTVEPVKEEEPPGSSSASSSGLSWHEQAEATRTAHDRRKFMQQLIKSIPKRQASFDDYDSDAEDNAIRLLDDDNEEHCGWSHGLSGLKVVSVYPYDPRDCTQKIMRTRGREPLVVKVEDERHQQRFRLVISARQLRNDFPSSHEFIRNSPLPCCRAVFEYQP